MESELLSGNIDVVSGDNGKSSSFVSSFSSWDRSAYADRTALEREVNNTYKIGDKVAQPSKMQNRKHQINSLAAAAAQSELEMYEMKGNRNKTRAETQAKYGW